MPCSLTRRRTTGESNSPLPAGGAGAAAAAGAGAAGAGGAQPGRDLPVDEPEVDRAALGAHRAHQAAPAPDLVLAGKPRDARLPAAGECQQAAGAGRSEEVTARRTVAVQVDRVVLRQA